MSYLELAERLEGLSVPDRTVDRSIDCIIRVERGEGFPPIDEVPAYTASLDAAMTLVPEGWTDVQQHRHRMKDGSERSYVKVECDVENMSLSEEGRALTPALAICAAALRARATQPPGKV